MTLKNYLLLVLLAAGATASQAGDLSWKPATGTGAPFIQPQRYAVVETPLAALDALLQAAPTTPEKGVLMPLPLPGGGTQLFRVWRTPIGDAALSQRYPELQTYTGAAVGRSNATAKIDRTPYGFHALILDGRSSTYIDPYNATAANTFLVYDRNDLAPSGTPMRCDVETAAEAVPAATGAAHKSGGTVRRTYRLALACTGEYAAAVAGAGATKAQVLAKMITTVNRVNGVYERELAMTLQLVGNTDTLIFLDGNTDPYSNTSGSSMLGENQSTVTARIGNANYDIGHVFSTGGGGIAISGVCSSNFKARGVTGGANPVGDAFDIDYVAHEMGHQFNADHTFNASTGSCGGGNGVSNSAYEPGSGSTIMAYAGICGSSDNLQQNSDPYFHLRSLDQISTAITTGGASTCPVLTPTLNVPAVIPSYKAVYTIPALASFDLTAPVATDATADGPLTYCWEELDLGQFGSSLATTTTGPIFRSYRPDTARTRSFPSRRTQVFRPNYLGEKRPAVTRSMRFLLTVRDVYNGLGCFNWSSGDTVRVNVIAAAADTFRVLSFNTPVQLGSNQLDQTVQWNVSNSAVAPISCNAVDIYYSTDSGQTWPYLLKSGTDNDGSEAVTLPGVPTTGGRIQVKAADNIFYDINDYPLEILSVPSGIGGLAQDNDVQVYPVPATTAVTLQVPATWGTAEASIRDAVGRTVWSGRISGQQTLPVAAWARGVYFFHVQGANAAPVVRRFSIGL